MTITYVFEGNLYINITNQCPNNCEFCLRNNTDSVGDSESLWLDREPSKEEILSDILKRDLKKYPELVFCGYGEPTCRLDDMLYICSKIKEISNIKKKKTKLKKDKKCLKKKYNIIRIKIIL